MLQNIFVAGSPRQPQAHGIHLEHINTVSDDKVCKVLARLESLYPLVGSSLLPVFYPAGFKAPSYQQDFWRNAELLRSATIASISEDVAEDAASLDKQGSKTCDTSPVIEQGDIPPTRRDTDMMTVGGQCIGNPSDSRTVSPGNNTIGCEK